MAHSNKLMQLEKNRNNQKYKNPSVNFSEMYGSMAPDFLQLSAYDHENDTDDLLETQADIPRVVVQESQNDDDNEE